MNTRGFTVMLPNDSGEWGKNQPDGPFQLVRETLKRIHEGKEGSKPKFKPLTKTVDPNQKPQNNHDRDFPPQSGQTYK